MVSIIDDKKFELITKKENFSFAYDIYESFETIKERLITEFWDLLMTKLKEEFPQIKLNPDEEMEAILNLKVYKPVKFYINIYEKEFDYGMAVPYNGTQKNARLVEETFETFFDSNERNPELKLIYFYFDKNEDFSTLSDLKKTLPEDRDRLAETFISRFKNMMERNKQNILDFRNK